MRALLLTLALALTAPCAFGESLSLQRWTPKDGLPQSTVTSISQDRDGYIWAGTIAGLVRFDGHEFRVFDRASSPELPSDNVTTLLADPTGGLWVGTRGGLVRMRKGQRAFVLTQADGLPNSVVEALALDSLGHLWIGTRGGLARWKDGELREFVTDYPQGGRPVFALAVDREAAPWIGAHGGLSRKVEGDGFESFDSPDSLGDLFILSLEADPRGYLWIGTAHGGLQRFDPVRGQSSTLAGTEGHIILALLLDPDLNLWIGTRDGLLRFRDGRLETLPELAGRTIFSIFRDREDHLWIGTRNEGLFRLVPGEPKEESNGLNPPEEAIRPPAPVLIESLRIDSGSELPAGFALPVPKGKADVELFFTAMDFDNPDTVSFRHILEGYDDHWSEPSSQRYASFTNLPPGEYRFRIRLADHRTADGAYDAVQEFRIAPYFYQTTTFLFLCFLASGLILRALYKLRLRRVLQTQANLEELVRSHTEEILDQKNQLAASYQRLERANRLLKSTNQELKARNREKSDFLAIATHDLRAPLVNLKGFSSELAMALARAAQALRPQLARLKPEERRQAGEILDEAIPEYLGFIDSAATRIERLIEPILRISRIGRRSLQYRPISLKELVEDLLFLHQLRLKELGIVTQVDPLESVLADENAIRETLEHILFYTLTSLEASPDGRIEIRNKRNENDIIISFSHNGTPVQDDHEARMFRIFGQNGIEDGTRGDVELAYAKALVQRLGGKIWFRSAPSTTSLYFSIPRNPGKAHP